MPPAPSKVSDEPVVPSRAEDELVAPVKPPLPLEACRLAAQRRGALQEEVPLLCVSCVVVRLALLLLLSLATPSLDALCICLLPAHSYTPDCGAGLSLCVSMARRRYP